MEKNVVAHTGARPGVPPGRGKQLAVQPTDPPVVDVGRIRVPPVNEGHFVPVGKLEMEVLQIERPGVWIRAVLRISNTQIAVVDVFNATVHHGFGARQLG